MWGDRCDGSNEFYETPQLFVPLLRKNIVLLCCGYKHTFALSNTHKLYAWGYSKHSTLTSSPSSSSPPLIITDQNSNSYVLSPTTISLPENIDRIEQIRSGGMHTLLLDNKGVVYSWGQSLGYVTGHGHLEDIHEPSMIHHLSGYCIQHLSVSSLFNVAYYTKYSAVHLKIRPIEEAINHLHSLVRISSSSPLSLLLFIYLLFIIMM